MEQEARYMRSNHPRHVEIRLAVPADAAARREALEALLAGRGAYRVHGGGFAGTIQAYVPLDFVPAFKAGKALKDAVAK